MAHLDLCTNEHWDDFYNPQNITITRKQLPTFHKDVANWEAQRDVRVATKTEFFALIKAAAPDLLQLPWQEWCIHDTVPRTGIMCAVQTEGEAEEIRTFGELPAENGSRRLLVNNKFGFLQKHRNCTTSLEGRNVAEKVYGGAVGFADNDWKHHWCGTTALPEPADMMVTAHGLFHDPKNAKLFNDVTFAGHGQFPKLGTHKASPAWDMLMYYGLIDENPTPGNFGNERLNAMIQAVDQVFDTARQNFDSYGQYYLRKKQ